MAYGGKVKKGVVACVGVLEIWTKLEGVSALQRFKFKCEGNIKYEI